MPYWLDDLIFKLHADGVGTYGTNIFKGSKASIPVLPNGAATLQLISTGGTNPDRTHNSVIRPAYLRPTAQLTARADGYSACETMARAAFDSLVSVRNEFINSTWYQEIEPLQSEFIDLGVDEKKQNRLVFNVLGNKRP